MHWHREQMVRKAVARRIIHQARLQRIAKQRRISRPALATAATAVADRDCGLATHELSSTGASTATSPCHINTSTCNGDDLKLPVVKAAISSEAATAAVVFAALVAAMSAAQTDHQPSTCNELYTPPMVDSDDQFRLIRRIAELQREKDQLLQLISTDQYAEYGRLLELFCFGVLNDYKTGAAQVSKLNERLLRKLKHLTLVSLASQNKILKYDDLLKNLDFTAEQDVEELVIETTYNNLVKAKLDQKRRLVEVDYVVGRDVRREDLQNIYSQLEQWSRTCKDALNDLTRDIDAANASVIAQKNDSVEFERTLQNIRAAQATELVAPATDFLPRTDSQYASTEYQAEENRANTEAS
ncbi:COP9 signalosome complex subunit 7b [Coemansia sp. RSA 988]|nr:COP9 signalosome complex subunit 7b [Coemansia sp. RSA 988]